MLLAVWPKRVLADWASGLVFGQDVEVPAALFHLGLQGLVGLAQIDRAAVHSFEFASFSLQLSSLGVEFGCLVRQVSKLSIEQGDRF